MKAVFGAAVAAFLLLGAWDGAALAQPAGPVEGAARTEPAPDPRLVSPTLDALQARVAADQALIKLREAEMRALQQDAQKKLGDREREWAEWFKGWCGAACATAKPDPAAK